MHARDVRVEIKNCYFKHYSDDPQMRFISGLPLPNADYRTKTVQGIRFIGCDFHPACEDWTFRDCDFIGCSGNKSFTTESCWIPQESDNPHGLTKIPFFQKFAEPDKMSPGARRIIALSERD